MRRTVTFIAALAAVASLAVPALALDDNSGDVLGDPSNDSLGAAQSGKGDVDIVSATAATAKRGNLVHTVTVAGRIANPAKGEELVPLLLINVPSYPGATYDCDFYVGRTSRGAGVYECGYDTKVASARIVRAGRRTIRYTFPARAIRSPRAYGWAFGIRGHGNGGRIEFDRVPDGTQNFETFER
ncbi:MAG TPA: hypothetical protein VF520_15565 [Thermoleophilaceae bacterium]|jgi:hypothetical protein